VAQLGDSCNPSEAFATDIGKTISGPSTACPLGDARSFEEVPWLSGFSSGFISWFVDLMAPYPQLSQILPPTLSDPTPSKREGAMCRGTNVLTDSRSPGLSINIRA
jgi:hypothetical protein